MTDDWYARRAAARGRSVARFDAAVAADYDATPGLGWLSAEEAEACARDIGRSAGLEPGISLLDVGAGSGALCEVLLRFSGLSITALEPSPAMLQRLRSRPALAKVRTVQGSCDAAGDRPCFNGSEFDIVASRQLINGLFDPLIAFSNWHHWLKPGGRVLAIDGLYGRADWTGAWSAEVDDLPLSACQSMALLPYLLDAAGFRIETVAPMRATNALPTTRTPRYVVVARKPA